MSRREHCIICGEKITGRRYKYCSAECANYKRKERQKARQKIIYKKKPRSKKKEKKPLIPCVICGEMTRWQRLCSPKCREIYERKQKNIKRASGRNFQLNTKSGMWRRMYYDIDGNIIKKGPWLVMLSESFSIDEKLKAIEA